MREYVMLRLPQEAWEKLGETLELDAKSSAFDPELRKEMREPDDGARYYRRYCCGKCGVELPDEIMDRINEEEFREEAVR